MGAREAVQMSHLFKDLSMYVPTGSMRGCTGVTHFPNIYLCMHRLHVCRFVRCRLPLRHAAGLCRSVPGIVVHGVRPALMLVLRSHIRGGMQGTRPIACHGCRGLRILHTWEHAKLYRCHILPNTYLCMCRLHACRFVSCQLPLRHAAGLCRSVLVLVVHGVRPALMLVLR